MLYYYIIKLGRGFIYYNGSKYISNDMSLMYLMSDTLVGIELAFNFLFIGFNPRLELPLLN